MASKGIICTTNNVEYLAFRKAQIGGARSLEELRAVTGACGEQQFGGTGREGDDPPGRTRQTNAIVESIPGAHLRRRSSRGQHQEQCNKTDSSFSKDHLSVAPPISGT